MELQKEELRGDLSQDEQIEQDARTLRINNLRKMINESEEWRRRGGEDTPISVRKELGKCDLILHVKS